MLTLDTVYKKLTLFLLPVMLCLLNAGSVKAAPSLSVRGSSPTSVRVYEKYEVKFNVSTSSKFPFFEYDTNPPPGIQSGIGINVTGEFSANGKTWRQPAFYMTETTQSGTGSNIKFAETGNKYWAVRFAPLEQGNYSVKLIATDSTGTSELIVGNFSATSPTRDGFIQVSKTDSRYFEFSNGKIFWPLGPVYSDEDFTKYKNTGLNFARPWMGGMGAYSANWARWKSSAEDHGNEGIATRLAFLSEQDRYPGSDGLAYDLTYPDAHRYWLSAHMDEISFTPIKPNTTYNVRLVAKTIGITGPRVANYPFGLAVKFGPSIWNNPTNEQVESELRTSPQPFSHIGSTQGNNGWQVFQTSFTTPAGTGSDIWVYLDNVTAGKAYIYELSIKDQNGAEIVRNPNADMHTYVEQRPAAFFDWQVNQAEANGIYLKYNVHDKNDPLFNSLKTDGTWGGWLQGSGYNQPYNSKSSWLKRQWYRYLIARWNYSPAIHSWEAVNEADPNDSVHWQSVRDNFAKYMKSIASRPTMTVTSFWCCSFRDASTFFTYPEIDYVDLHEYSGNPSTVTGTSYTYDLAEWVRAVGEAAFAKRLGKPLIWAENGLSPAAPGPWWEALTDSRLTSANPGTWYHNMLWAQLTRGAAFPIGYWFDTQHVSKITGGKQSISKPFYEFIKDIDYNKGGYVEAAATSQNSILRVYGQKRSDGLKAYLWIQNRNHEWDKTSTAVSGNISLVLAPNTSYTLQWWDTYTGTVSNTETKTSSGDGQITLSISNLASDIAVKIFTTAVPTTTPTVKRADANGDNRVNGQDYIIWMNGYGTVTVSPQPRPPITSGNFNNDYAVNGQDYIIWLQEYGL